MFIYDPDLPLIPDGLPATAVAVTMAYFSYAIHKGLSFKQALREIGIEPPANVPDSWNLIDLKDMCEIKIDSQGVRVTREEKLQTFFVSHDNLEILDD